MSLLRHSARHDAGPTPRSSVAHLSAEYSRFRLRLVLGLLALACLVNGVVFWQIYSSYVDRENAARLQSQTYVQTIAAHVADSIQLVDHALQGFVNAVKALPPERVDAAAIRQLLMSHNPSSSDDLGVKFIHSNGRILEPSNAAAYQGLSLADTDFFHAHAGASADLGLYVGQPVMAKVARKRIFTLSRRVLGAHGEFLGVVIAPMDAARFASMFELARLNRDITIGLVHGGGKMIARVPLFEQTFAVKLIDSPASIFHRLYEPPATGIKLSSGLDGRMTIYSARALQNLPLYVSVGIATEELDRMLRINLLIGAAGVALVAALMSLIAHFSLNSYLFLASGKQALQESEFRWKFALEGAGEGVWDWQVLTGEVQFSQRWKQMLGYAEHEIEDTSQAWKTRLHPDDEARVTAQVQACLAGTAPLYCSEYRLRCSDGSWKWILARGMVVSRDGAGLALRMIGTHADIADRKQAEQAQVQRIVEAAPDPMLLIGKDDIIGFANAAAQSAFGYTLAELTGQNVNNLLPFKSRSRHAQWRNVLGSRELPLTLKKPLAAVHRDGSEFSVEISLSPFQMDGQAVVIASIRDIGESRRAAQLLEQSYARLRLLSDHQQNIKEDERKRIARDMHDDLGQNLMVLKMDVGVLAARTAGAHPRLHRRAAIVLGNIDATIRAVKAIMNDLRPATLELGLYPALEWQVMQFQRMSGIACTLGPDSGFELDEGRTLAVFRILQEALTNVARHAEASRVEIELSQDARGFAMRVQDNGKGLQPGDRKKANSFGLMGIRERIHALGGELTITSSPGQGTLLSIFIGAGATQA